MTGFYKCLFEASINSFMTEVPIIHLHRKSLDWFLYDRDLRYERVNRCFDNCLFIGIFGKVDQIRKGKEEDTEKLTLYWIHDCVNRFLWKVYCDFDDSSFLASEIHVATLLTRKVPIRNVFWLGMGLGICSSVKCKSTKYLLFTINA